jgi:FlaA1/EpsC-like NDP-sugar epimerase
VRILDLANRMIHLTGLEPGRDIEITFTGFRPGERLNEILFSRDEPISEIGIDGIVAAKPVTPPMDMIRGWLKDLEQGLQQGDRKAVHRVLASAVPDYREQPD